MKPQKPTEAEAMARVQRIGAEYAGVAPDTCDVCAHPYIMHIEGMCLECKAEGKPNDCSDRLQG